MRDESTSTNSCRRARSATSERALREFESESRQRTTEGTVWELLLASAMNINFGAERQRLAEAREEGVPWRRWGPYLSERQWGTVREDYSRNGDAWAYFGHDQARSRAYRWGEDGLAGFSDDQQRLCFAVALWNERDPILKERLFGLTNAEGNHGEDVKEYYFYLDSTPTHSYMKWLYKYSQREYPYLDLVETNRRRSRQEFEYELLDTGVFQDSNYFDVFTEYAKEGPEDILIRLTRDQSRIRSSANSPAADALVQKYLEILPRNRAARAVPHRGPARDAARVGRCIRGLGERFLYVEGDDPLLFTENETNNDRLFAGTNATRYVKDGINDYVVRGQRDAREHRRAGNESVGASRARARERRVAGVPAAPDRSPAGNRSAIPSYRVLADLRLRRQEADEFYSQVIPRSVKADGGRDRAAGARRDALDEAILLLRPREVAARARD